MSVNRNVRVTLADTDLDALAYQSPAAYSRWERLGYKDARTDGILQHVTA
jgi:hypothetical protein